jgi:hypothetical protein
MHHAMLADIGVPMIFVQRPLTLYALVPVIEYSPYHACVGENWEGLAHYWRNVDARAGDCRAIAICAQLAAAANTSRGHYRFAIVDPRFGHTF